MSRFAIFDQAGSDLIVMAIPITDGRGRETFLEVEAPQQYDTIQSADGLVIRCKTQDRVYKVTLTLLSSSSHSAILSALHGADAVATGGSGVGAFFYKDNTGSTALAGEHCWISMAPKRSVGNMVKEESWELTVVSDPAKMIFGGNSL
jgi:hypothetical protein